MKPLLLALLLLAPTIPSPGGPAPRQDEESATVRGRVLDPHHQPLAGAQVELRTHVGGPAWNWGSIGVRADAEGRFECGVLPPGSTTAIARAPGWASSPPQVFELEPDQVVEGLELVLGHGGRLTGEILGPDGSPDALRTIRVQSTRASERFGRQVLSDPQGFFELECLDPGSYRLAAVPEELARAGLAAGPENVGRVRMATVEIRAGETTHVLLGAAPATPVRLHGKVALPGLAAHRVMVAILGADSSGPNAIRASPVEADGSYALTFDGPGEHLVLVGDPRTGEPLAEYLLAIPAAPEHQLDLELPRGAVRGRVFAADGRGVEGVPLALHREGLPSVFDALGGRRARSGPDGRFAFELLPPGDYTARAGVAFEGAWNPTGHAVAVSPKLTVAAGRALEDVELELAQPATLAGVVLDAAGHPVVGATVFVRDGEGRLLDPLSALRTGAEGRFTVAHVGPGQVTACARTAGACSPESAPVQLRAGGSAELRLVLEPATLLYVRVVATSAGQPRASLRVLDELDREVGELRDLERVKARPAAEVLARERTFGPLPPGTYRVIASGPDGPSIEQRVRLDGEPSRSLVLRR